VEVVGNNANGDKKKDVVDEVVEGNIWISGNGY
jgi:hypothetical protein